MRSLGALQAHLDTAATTLCWCWRVTRNDGVRLGFTDHDRALSFDDTVFEAASGFAASAIEGAVGLNVDTLEAHSVLKSERLDEDELAAGLFDNALVEIWRVNWQDTAQRVLMRYGSLGEIARGELAFRAELRGLAHELNQPKGRTIQFACDADLGDARCGVALVAPTFAAQGTVASVESPRRFTATGPVTSFAVEWFSRGLLSWDTGANAGRSMEVKLHARIGSDTVFELWQRMAQEIAPGDLFTARAGCDKQFSTCREKFDNAVNFRGFPHVPGNDFAISYPNSDDADG